MDLSVIIVNYNVKHLLENCLLSVQKAAATISTEAIVVDNNSTDGSRDYLPVRFPRVKFIWNEENVGFAKACNQGLVRATGKCILFLNPDTIVSPDCFIKCIRFFENDMTIGAIGVRMIDENGFFLKESRRALPTPFASLFKLFGLSALFPRSAFFSKYNLGHINEFENHEAEVLCGAFMMIKKTVLDKTGGFDEAFFMYGEDIDLSYRITQAGYKNYYLGSVTLTHLKGKSTHLQSQAYLQRFYGAMDIFVNKHYEGGLIVLLHAAIKLRYWLSVVRLKMAGRR